MALEPVLTTKLYFPPQRPNLLPRPRLTAELSKGLGRSLTLISAPAGFGKTTLVSDWLRELDRPATWLSLDEGDNDPVCFFTYLIAALQKIDPGIGTSLSAALRTIPPPPLEALLSGLIGEIDAVSQPFILVLDDFHTVTMPKVQDAIAFILEHRPSHLHLVIITRTDPAFPLSRLRAQGDLIEVRAADLCFTQEEAATFLNEISGLRFTPQQIRDLETRTEGWIAGLQLVTLSMVAHRDSANFIADFTGSHRYITDYLTEEVLRGQPVEIQSFLLQTSLLDRLSAPLCEALLSEYRDSSVEDLSPGVTLDPQLSSQQILEYLDRANLFIVPLDEVRQWYRYHHLFSDVLRNRLRQVYPQRVLDIHHKAAQWYQVNGFIGDALHHALTAGDFDWAAEMVEQNARKLLMHGEVITLINWAGRLPPEVSLARPWLLTHYGTALMLTGQIQAAEPLFEQAEQYLSNVDPAQRRHIQGDIAAMRANIAARRGDVSRTIDLSHQALENLPAEDLTLRSVVAYILGNACYLNLDFTGAGEAFQDAARIGQEAGNIHIAVAAICSLARMRTIQGRPHQAFDLYKQAERLAAEQGENQSRMMDYGYAWIADLLRERNELETARRILEQHLRNCEQRKSKDAVALSSAVLARTLQALGNLDQALNVIHRAQTLTHGYSIDLMNIGQLYAAQVILWIARGNLAEAARGLQAWQSSHSELPPLLRVSQGLIRARLSIAEHKFSAALDALPPLEVVARAGGFNRLLIEVLVLKSLALQAGNDNLNALSALEEALRIAGLEGYVRIFADEGRPIAELFLQMRRHTPDLKVDIDKILRVMVKDPTLSGSQAGGLRSSALLEPLTARETEVFKLIAAGCSNQEIADKLVIEVNTVKRHISNVFAKLGVQSRTQAIARGQELELL